MEYDVIAKNQEIKELEEQYSELCSRKRNLQEKLMETKLMLTRELNEVDGLLIDLNLTLSKMRREFHLNKTDASRVEKLRKQFSRKKASLYKQVVEKYGKKCNYCSTKSNLELHHQKPLSHGGDNEVENLVLACQDCHERLH